MTEQNHLRTSSDGISTQGSRQNLNAISAIVMGLALIWVIFCGFVFWSVPPVSTEAALVFSGAALLPAAVLGVCALMIQKFQSSHQDAHRLHTAVEALNLFWIRLVMMCFQTSGSFCRATLKINSCSCTLPLLALGLQLCILFGTQHEKECLNWRRPLRMRICRTR